MNEKIIKYLKTAAKNVTTMEGYQKIGKPGIGSMLEHCLNTAQGAENLKGFFKKYYLMAEEYSDAEVAYAILQNKNLLKYGLTHDDVINHYLNHKYPGGKNMPSEYLKDSAAGTTNPAPVMVPNTFKKYLELVNYDDAKINEGIDKFYNLVESYKSNVVGVSMYDIVFAYRIIERALLLTDYDTCDDQSIIKLIDSHTRLINLMRQAQEEEIRRASQQNPSTNSGSTGGGSNTNPTSSTGGGSNTNSGSTGGGGNTNPTSSTGGGSNTNSGSTGGGGNKQKKITKQMRDRVNTHFDLLNKIKVDYATLSILLDQKIDKLDKLNPLKNTQIYPYYKEVDPSKYASEFGKDIIDTCFMLACADQGQVILVGYNSEDDTPKFEAYKVPYKI